VEDSLGTRAKETKCGNPTHTHMSSYCPSHVCARPVRRLTCASTDMHNPYLYLHAVQCRHEVCVGCVPDVPIRSLGLSLTVTAFFPVFFFFLHGPRACGVHAGVLT